MATTNRAATITKTYRLLKKHVKPIASAGDRTLLENLLYACCLENAPHDKADEVFARLQQQFFDWNEVRVSTAAELAEVMPGLPDPMQAASNLKRCLQAVFEAHYSFDLEFLKKQNIGKTVKQLEKFPGMTPFVVSYVVQRSLGGHSIPLDQGAMQVMYVVGVVTEAEAEGRVVPGLERAIPKNKGVDFGNLLHQFGAEFLASPHSPQLRGVLSEIAADAKDRFPKRRPKRAETAAAPEAAPAPPPPSDAKAAKGARPSDKQPSAAAKSTDGKSADAKSADAKSADAKSADGKSSDAKSADAKRPAKAEASSTNAKGKRPAKKEPAGK